MGRSSYSDKVYLLSYPRLWIKTFTGDGLRSNMRASGYFLQALESRDGYTYFEGETRVNFVWDTKYDNKTVSFDYTLVDKFNGKEYHYTREFNLIQKPSNLPNNKGSKWYFQDQHSGVCSTYLIFTGGGLKVRDAKKYYYPSQMFSHKDRITHQYNYSKYEKVMKEWHDNKISKHVKSHYRGKKTLRQVNADKKMRKYDRGLVKMEEVMIKQLGVLSRRMGF